MLSTIERPSAWGFGGSSPSAEIGERAVARGARYGTALLSALTVRSTSNGTGRPSVTKDAAIASRTAASCASASGARWSES